MRDPRVNPRPGDVLQIRPNWTRHIDWFDGKRVGFHAIDHGVRLGPFSDALEDWRTSVSGLAEVLHVAENES